MIKAFVAELHIADVISYFNERQQRATRVLNCIHMIQVGPGISTRSGVVMAQIKTM